jgi:predicted Zn-dependent protease
MMRSRRMLTVVLATSLAAGCGVSTQQEVQLGNEYAAQIEAQLPIVQDYEINRYINVLGDSIAGVADDRGLDWTFRVVNAPEINAFAVPGGHIYINRGLIERAQNMAQVAGVLGHEIGHVTRRHSIEQMEKAQKANIGITLACALTGICNNQAAAAAIQVGGAAVFANFSRQDEQEADEVGVAYVTRAGIDPRGIPAMFRILLNERAREPSGVDAWFSSHPLEEDRIAATEALIAQIDPAILSTLTMDSPNFRLFKQRIAALPPAPVAQSR